MAEVASAFVSLMPSARGFGREAESQVSGEMKKTGSRVGKFFSGAMKKTAVGAMAAVGATAGTALFKGFNRLKGIEEAQAKLTGLGHSAKSVDKIMDNALGAVKGTAFGLADAATVAASAVAAGIEPGKALERTLTLVGDAATIAGTDMGSMGAIFNKVAASNKLQMDSVNQLHDAGIPALQLVAKQLGVTAEEASKMASKGEVDFATFQKAMQKGLGGAAQESGKTFSGSLANMQAALGRLGAKILEPVFAAMPDIIGRITSALDELGPYAEAAADAMARYGSAAVEKAAPVLTAIYEAVRPLVQLAWGKITDGANALRKLAKVDFGSIDTKSFGENLGKTFVDSIIKSLSAVKDIGAKLVKVVAGVDWIGLGIKAGTYLIPFALGLATGVLNGVTEPALWQGIWDHLPEILMAGLAIAFAPAKLAGGLARVLGKIPFVGSFLAASVRWLNELGGKLLKFGGDLAGVFWRGFTSIIGKFPGAGIVSGILRVLRGIMPKIKNFFSTLTTRIGVWALDAFEAIGKGAGRGVSNLFGFLRALPGRILAAIGGLARLLFPRGMQLLEGLLNGARNKWGEAVAWLGGLGSRIRGVVGDLGSLLVDIGKSIIDGLFRGLKAAWDAGSGWLSSVGGKIRDLKGPPKKDKILLVDIGEMIIEGLFKGMNKAWTKGARRTIAPMTKGIQKFFSMDIKKIGPAMVKSMKDVLKAVEKAAQQATKRVDLFKELRNQVRDAFSPDLFSGTMKDLLSGLSTQLAGNKAALAALPKLMKSGLSKGFLESLMASGNYQLITGLAGADAAALTQLQSIWDQMNSTASQLGNKVAKNSVGSSLKSLEQKADRLNNLVERLDKRIGKAVGNELNKGARKGKRGRRR